jgi:hypothetical protein
MAVSCEFTSIFAQSLEKKSANDMSVAIVSSLGVMMSPIIPVLRGKDTSMVWTVYQINILL